MPEQITAVVDTPVTQTPATPVPLGELNSVSEYMERRAKGETGEPIAKPDTPAAKPAETPAVEADPDPASEAGKALAKQRGSLQARIDELTRKNGDAERQARQREAELLAEIAAAKANKPNDPNSAASQQVEGVKGEYKRIMALPGAPNVSDFETYEEFQFAASLFVNDVRAGERDQKQQAEAASRSTAEAHVRAYEAAKAAHADVDDVMTAFANAGHAFSPVVRDVVLNHPLGHELAYALAKDPAKNTEIASIQHPGLALIKIGEVLAGLSAAPKPAVPVKKVSSAPAPIEPVAPTETASASPDPANISSVATWQRERKKYL